MPPFWRTGLPLILLTSLTCVLVLAVVFLEPVRDRVFSIFADREDSSNNFRRNVWTAVFNMIHDYPITGIGPGHSAFNKIYPIYQLPRYSALSAYSIFLEVIVETGFIGLACFLWLLIVIFNTGLVQLRRLREIKSVDGFWIMGAIAALAGTLAHNLFDTVWFRPEVNTVWWLMVGLIACYYQSMSQGRARELDSPNPEPTAS